MSLSTFLPEPGRRAVVALSGGMDSTSLLLHLLARNVAVHGISFDYGQRHRLELERLQANLDLLERHGLRPEWRLVRMGDVGQLLDSALTQPDRDMPTGYYAEDTMRATVVPNRNAIFSSIAWGWAWSLSRQHDEPVALALGVHAGDHAIYPDCRPDFYQALSAAFAAGNWESERVPFYLPWLEADKSAILRDAETSTRQLGLDFDEVFRNTCTSYAPSADGRSHGLTGSDVERILAFDALGHRDPLDYEDPWPDCVARARELQRQHLESETDAPPRGA